MFFLASRGYRCIAHDRRGHGRSSQPWNGNDLDTYADDLAELVEAARPQGCDPCRPFHRRRRGRPLHRPSRHRARGQGGADRRDPAADAEDRRPIPAALPIEVFDQLRAGVQADRSQFWKDLSLPFYGYNRPGAKISEGVRESFWLQGMMAGFPASYFCIKAFSETDLTEDLKKIRRADAGPARRRRPDRADRRLGAAVVEADQERHAQGLQGRAARHVHDAQGPGQRGAARVHPKREHEILGTPPKGES